MTLNEATKQAGQVASTLARTSPQVLVAVVAMFVAVASIFVMWHTVSTNAEVMRLAADRHRADMEWLRAKLDEFQMNEEKQTSEFLERWTRAEVMIGSMHDRMIRYQEETQEVLSKISEDTEVLVRGNAAALYDAPVPSDRPSIE